MDEARKAAREAAARAAVVQLGMDPDDSSMTNGETRWQTEKPTTDAAIDAYEAALKEMGLVIVPETPTDAMHTAFNEVAVEVYNHRNLSHAFEREVWSAMIAAASQGDGG